MLSDVVHEKLRAGHYSHRTEEAYLAWIRRFIRFHGRRHPRDLREPAVVAFLENLAGPGHVSASTQNQALNALAFLYEHVLEQKLGSLGEFARARRPERLPAVLSREEARALLNALEGSIKGSVPHDDGYRPAENGCNCLNISVAARMLKTLAPPSGPAFRPRLQIAGCLTQDDAAPERSLEFVQCWFSINISAPPYSSCLERLGGQNNVCPKSAPNLAGKWYTAIFACPFSGQSRAGGAGMKLLAGKTNLGRFKPTAGWPGETASCSVPKIC